MTDLQRHTLITQAIDIESRGVDVMIQLKELGSPTLVEAMVLIVRNARAIAAVLRDDGEPR